MTLISDVAYTAALTAGLFSFFSPCILPLVPSYFTFITGVSLNDLTETPDATVRRKIIVSTLAFVTGFSVVFILLGASAAFLSSFIVNIRPYIRVIGGLFIIVLGLHLLGVFRIRALDVEKRLEVRRTPVRFFGIVAVGMAFGAGWSPCIGPLLGAILILAGNQDTVTQGVWLLAIYSAGLAIPFVVLSLCITFLMRFIRRASKTLRYINVGAGILLIVTGVLLITDKLRLLASF